MKILQLYSRPHQYAFPFHCHIRWFEISGSSFTPDPEAPRTADMADKKPSKSDAPFATRIDPTKESISQEQMHFIRQVELEQWKRRSSKLRTRNVATGLAIGALVLGIYGYTFFSVSQERIMDEIDEEAKRARLQGPKTGAN